MRLAATLSLTGHEGVQSPSPLQAYPPGVELFQQGEPAEKVYLIHRGLVKLVRCEENGQEMIVGLRREGWFLGAAAVILGGPSLISATTVTRSHFSEISAEQFRHRLKNDNSFSRQIHELHSAEILSQTIRFAQLANLGARRRLEHLLWELVTEQEDLSRKTDIKLDLCLKHWELAQLLAITPIHLSRLLKQLENDRLILRSKGWLIIHSLDNLAQSQRGPRQAA